MLGGGDLLIGALPALGWLWWIRRKDRCEPEPWSVVTAVFLLGAVAALATVSLRPRIEAFVMAHGTGASARFLDAFVVTAFVEETLKFAAFALGALWHAEWDEPLDGIVYGATAGLGFAAVENGFFVWATGDPSLVVARGFTATLAHVCFSGGFGLFVGLARFCWHGWRVPWAAFGALGAIASHGAYDFWATDGTSSKVSLFAALLGLVGFLAITIRWAHRRSTQCVA